MKWEIRGDIAICAIMKSKVYHIVTIDSEDVPRVAIFKWGISHTILPGVWSNFYVTSCAYVRGPEKYQFRVALHRLIMSFPDGMDVDHINGDKLDNRKVNLRACTRSQNIMNIRTVSKNNIGIRGVFYRKSRDAYISRIMINGKSKFLGYFKSAELAKQARITAELELFKEYSPHGV